MIDAIRFEWIKLRSVRSTVFTFAVAVGVVVLAAVIAASQAPPGTYHEDQVTVGVTIANLLFGILGVQIIGQEYRFNTIRTTFTAIPNRVQVLTAKLIVIVLASAVFAAVMLAISLAAGKLIMGSNLVLDASDRGPLLGLVAFAALWAATGLAVGAIVRQPIAGILVLVVWPLLVEVLLGNLVAGSRPWLPFMNGIQMTLRHPGNENGLRSPGGGALYFVAVTSALTAVGFALARRRDA